jgi:hypothetical protein
MLYAHGVFFNNNSYYLSKKKKTRRLDALWRVCSGTIFLVTVAKVLGGKGNEARDLAVQWVSVDLTGCVGVNRRCGCRWRAAARHWAGEGDGGTSSRGSLEVHSGSLVDLAIWVAVWVV